jgi:hypothetical protein
VTPGDAELIRAYVARQARILYDAELAPVTPAAAARKR